MTDATIDAAADATADAVSAHGDDHHHGAHPTEKNYWVVFAILDVLTAVEVAWSYIGLDGAALVLPLIAMMVAKFILVAGVFMHLYFDFSIRNGGMFTYMFAFGLVVAILVYAVVLITYVTR